MYFETYEDARISIHPPRAGRDLIDNVHFITEITFQSTRPVRGGTIQAHRIKTS